MKNINLIALNADFEIISLLSYTNLQWNRKYHESGYFSVQIPLEQYRNDICYVYTKDRPEMGKVGQINYREKNGVRSVQISGYFLEKQLDKYVVYPTGAGNIENAPAWIEQSGAAEDVAIAFFDGFKTVVVDGVTANLDITRSESQGRGNTAKHTRNGEKLGAKVYDILKPSGMSYRVSYDFLNSTQNFEVWGGLDRTDSQYDNNPVTFSTKFGNIKNPDVLLDESNYCTGAIVAREAQMESEQNYVRAVLEATDGDFRFTYVESVLRPDDYTTTDEFYSALENEAHLEILKRTKTVSVEFDALVGSYEYMTDFNLGDKCNVEIPEIGFYADSRLIGCYEVIKNGAHALTLEFGTPIINNARRK
jgi:hypothetical protein